MSAPAPIKQGSKLYELGESWTSWWLFNRLTNREVAEVLEEYDIHRYYSGPGQLFTGMASIKHSKRWTLIKQHGGYDI